MALALELSIQAPVVAGWIAGKRPVPVRHALPIEWFTSGAVTRKDVRPDDWHLIWPELAEAQPQQAPAAITAVACGEGGDA